MVSSDELRKELAAAKSSGRAVFKKESVLEDLKKVVSGETTWVGGTSNSRVALAQLARGTTVRPLET